MDAIPGVSPSTQAKLEALEKRLRAGEPFDRDKELSQLCSRSELVSLSVSGEPRFSDWAMNAVVSRAASLEVSDVEKLVRTVVDPKTGEGTCLRAAEAVARTAAGVTRLEAVMRGGGSAQGKVCAAFGLSRRDSAATAASKKEAQVFQLEALGNEDDSGRVASNELQPIEEWMERWILDRLSSPPVAPRMLERGMRLLTGFGDRYRVERKAVFLANLNAPTVSARQAVVSGLVALGLTAEDLPTCRKIMKDQEPQVRRMLYGGADPKRWMVPIYIDGLSDALDENRLSSARALGALEEKTALPALIELLRKGRDAKPGFPRDAREAGAAISAIAGLKNVDFEERTESFGAGPGMHGLRRVERPEAWRQDAEAVLEWWEKQGKAQLGGKGGQ